jgi:hypothetical protein
MKVLSDVGVRHSTGSTPHDGVLHISVVSKAITAASTAHTAIIRQIDASKDYICSTWSDNELRSWLAEHGVIKMKSQRKHDEPT